MGAAEYLLAASVASSTALGYVAWRLLLSLREARSELARLTKTDPLTGLPDRQAGMERFEAELARAHRDDTTLACVVFDLDDFRRVNDEHGRSAGDDVLAATAEALRDSARAYDVVARLGGEEFLAVLPACSVQEATAIVERMRQAVFGSTAAVLGVSGVTASAGIALHEPGWIESVDELLSRADAALRAAERIGRDTLHIAPALSALQTETA